MEFSSNSTIQETTVPGTYAELTSVGHYEESSVDSEVRKDLITFVIKFSTIQLSKSASYLKKKVLCQPACIVVRLIGLMPRFNHFLNM